MEILPKNENEEIDLEKLREIAKLASIFHQTRVKYERNKNLSHVVHASLHIFQFIIGLSIIIFHFIHHYVNKERRKKDETYPYLPEEGNPIFLIYPFCIIMSICFAAIWIFKKNIFMKKPLYVLIGCFISACLMLIVGIIEMKHTDLYIDLDVVSDSELLQHPIFIHNFTMCLLSILCMSIYLVQGWILMDYYIWIKKKEKHPEFEPDVPDIQVMPEKEAPGELDPIPTLETFPTITVSKKLDIEEEDVILYCFFVDWYNYLKRKRRAEPPLHEFQVIHVK